MTIVFALLATVCAFGWLNSYVCGMAVLRCLVENDTVPSDEQIAENVKLVWQKVLGIN